MNQILKEIVTLDKKVKRDFIAEDVSVPDDVDLFFKWLPHGLVLISAASPTRRNTFVQNVMIVSLSEIILNSFVQPSKKLIDRRRPNSLYKYNSFPSGHAATSFCGAELLRLLLKDKSTPLSLTGYAAASIVSSLRLYKRKHWFSDVVAGAVTGIVAAKLTYMVYKKLNRSA